MATRNPKTTNTTKPGKPTAKKAAAKPSTKITAQSEKSADTIDIYLELGSKKVIACALEWPGWCRIARNEDEAIQALLDYAPRYHKAIQSAQVKFKMPKRVEAFKVVERLKGGTTTDFGAPYEIPKEDHASVSPAEMKRFDRLLSAQWDALAAAVKAAAGKTLTKGPRGGGRELDKIVEHTLDSEQSYLSAFGWKTKPEKTSDHEEAIKQMRDNVSDALAASAKDELPKTGPRGGKMWPARYFVRRSAWHILDHVWEIEDRSHKEESP